MERLDLSKYKITEQSAPSKLQSWQEEALQIIKDFNITNEKYLVRDINGNNKIIVKNFKAMIFRHACNNIQYLRGRVANAKEKFGEEGVKDKGHYLVSLFRKTPPWKNT